MFFWRRNRAQAVSEYAWLMAILIAALLAMKVYFQRAIQGKVKAVVDQINPYQYNPDTTISSSNTSINGASSFSMLPTETVAQGKETSGREYYEYTQGEVVEK